MKRTIQVLLVALIVFSTMLAACSPAVTPEPAPVEEQVEEAAAPEVEEAAEEVAEEPAEEPAPAPDPVTITVMDYSQEQDDLHQASAAKFQEEYPWITVEWTTMEQKAYNESLPLMFQSGEAPDVFFYKSTNNPVLSMQELNEQGWIRPLSEVPTDWQSRWQAGSFVNGINMIDGGVYSFPFNDAFIWGPGYMYMNMDVFAAAGLGADDAPETWSELKEVCQTIKSETGLYCLAIPLKGTDLQRTWYPLAGSIMTDRFFDYQNGAFSIDDPRLLEAFSFIQDLYAEDLVVPGVEDKTFSRAAMASGQAAIYFGGAWMPGVFAGMGFEDLNLDVAVAPAPDTGRSGALQAAIFSENKYWVNADTESPEAATLFIEWMTRPDGFFAQNYLEAGLGTLAFADNAAFITDPVMQKVIAIHEGMKVIYPEPLMKCPDLAQSKAFLDAEALRPNWEWEEMVLALTSGADFGPVAAEIAMTKDEILKTTLEAEAAAGLNVSVDCYTNLDWDITTNYTGK